MIHKIGMPKTSLQLLKILSEQENPAVFTDEWFETFTEDEREHLREMYRVLLRHRLIECIDIDVPAEVSLTAKGIKELKNYV